MTKDLCYKCERRMFTCDMGICKSCGHSTASGMFSLCAQCAIAKNSCAACGGQLDAVKPPTPPDAKLLHCLSVDTKHYLAGAPEPVGREARIAQFAAAIASVKSDLPLFLKAKGLPEDAVAITDELNELGMLYILCTQSTAKTLRSMSGVKSVSAFD